MYNAKNTIIFCYMRQLRHLTAEHAELILSLFQYLCANEINTLLLKYFQH